MRERARMKVSENLLEGLNKDGKMAELGSVIANDLANYYEHVAKELHKWVDPLSKEQFWRNP